MITRRGLMTLELICATAVLGVLLTLGLQMLSAAAEARRATDQRQCGLVELGNVMERVAGRPWPDLTTAALARESLSPWCAGRLPGARLTIEVAAAPGRPEGRRITAALSWEDRSGGPAAPLRLTAWRYRREP